LHSNFTYLEKINASIITIGDELLIGQTIDTNSAFIAQELNKIGVWVRRRVAVGDLWDDIWKALDEESNEADIVLITGGLGPTADDITKPLLCKYFDGKLVVDENVLEHVKNIFKRLNRPVIDRNLKQAEVPDVCTVLHNPRGTAPGMMFMKTGNSPVGETSKKVFFSLPGVPHEMAGLITDQVIPKIKELFTLPAIVHRTAFTAGQGESFIAELLMDFESKLPGHIKLAYLPSYGMVKLRLTATGNTKEELEKEIYPFFEELKFLVKDILVTDMDEGLEIVTGKILKAKSKTMATAESCTGGNIARLITSVPGSSAYYKGSIVSYDNEAKKNILGVRKETLKEFGAVSEQTVTEMVKGAIEKMNADYAVATSGIMGPGGGSAEKPVGTIWIAAGNKEKITTLLLNLRFDRQRNTEITSLTALNLLRKFILDN
jgi:nicotinamide-nucleotide amidase